VTVAYQNLREIADKLGATQLSKLAMIAE
jgi:hypothetical protein